MKKNITKETYLPLYRRNEKSIKFFITIDILIFIVGLAGLGSNLFIGKNAFLDLSVWNSLIFMAITTASIFALAKSLQDQKYYISWNEEEINFLLPKQKKPECVRVIDIKDIFITDREIKMILNNNQQKSINLNLFFLPKRDIVKNYFEILSKENEKTGTNGGLAPI
ncbi:MAG: hypothetical protein JG782_101 [Anaerophaga sp.]|uniref:hypothetical protein n=1 Tax=Anaerophaga thermohalophila TaxID=177400 RepID=UPI000237BA96|nr:hypothetical protein [Anaerophaga thermohalophila]MBZ4675482.1 hypothetical protein [Anaerophaga sp.]MDK2841385.1 hypothetical protein [Anaerophaga sp.]MDN5291454.1 hypothetical protein [Anaerophaga sp.]